MNEHFAQPTYLKRQYSQALPALADTELAPAIGLIFKLADETSASCAEAVKTVRRRVKKRQEALPGNPGSHPTCCQPAC